MPVSPKCPDCLDRGVIAQTYKMSGTQMFKCSVCNQRHPKEIFKDIDFEWDIKPVGLKKDCQDKGIK